MLKTTNGLTTDAFSIPKRMTKKRGACSVFFRNLNVMWAGNSLKNDLTDLLDL